MRDDNMRQFFILAIVAGISFIIGWAFPPPPTKPAARCLAMPGSVVIIGDSRITLTDTLVIEFTEFPTKYVPMTTPVYYEFGDRDPNPEKQARAIYENMKGTVERLSLIKFPDGRWAVIGGDPTAMGKAEVITKNY